MSHCPECGAGPFILAAGEALPEPTPSDVEIARITANAAERMALIDRGIDPDARAPLSGETAVIEVAAIVADADVAIATEEASAEVAAAEALGDAMVAAAEVVGDGLEAAAAVVADDDDTSGALPDEIVVSDLSTDDEAEAAGTGSRASRWGF